MYNLDMDGQTDGDKTPEDVTQETLPAVETVAVLEELVAAPENNAEAVVADEVPVAPEVPVAVEPIAEAVVAPESEPVTVAPAPIPVETPEPVEPIVVQEIHKSEMPIVIKEQASQAAEESVPEIADAVVAPVEKKDPMEIAKALDRDVLEAAFRLLAQERSATLLDAKKKSDKKKVDENSDRVEKFVAQYKKGVRRTTIADKLNMSPSKVTDYLQRLIASGRVRGEGKTNDRRFFIS